MPLTELQLYVDVAGDRAAALDLRDEIIAALKPLGIRVGMTDDGLVVFTSAPGVPTLGDQIAARSLEPTAAEGLEATCGHCRQHITLLVGAWTDDDRLTACTDPAAPSVPHRPEGEGDTR